MIEPYYLRLQRDGLLEERADYARDLLANCNLCPRRCGINRLGGEQGYCKTELKARVASFHSHFGEEAPLVGRGGSGTIFMSSCNLLCSFCQNYDISHLNEGREVEPEELADMMLYLMKIGCHNINFVTPSHVVPQILAALPAAVERGLNIPLIYNTGGYDLVETIRLLDGIFDIYMPDFKFWDGAWSERFCRAPDYRDHAQAAILEMHRQVGDLFINRQGLALRGLLVRHLVLPNNLAQTEEVMGFLAREISANTYVNVMDQYRPRGWFHEDKAINRRITPQEYDAALAFARRAGLTRLDGF